MSKSPTKSTMPLIGSISAVVLVVAMALLFAGSAKWLAAMTIASVALGCAFYYVCPPSRVSGGAARSDSMDIAIGRQRTEIVDAMAILQQEIRLLQGINAAAAEKKALREQIASLSVEVAALRQVVSQIASK